MTWVVQNYPKQGYILDPFLGSGTTTVTAKMLGRHYIGTEREPEYLKIAQQHLDLVQRPLAG